MKIIRHIRDRQTDGGKFLQRKIEERTIIRFEKKTAACRQETPVLFQKETAGQPSAGMTVLWPGVAKIDIESRDLARHENLLKRLNVKD